MARALWANVKKIYGLNLLAARTKSISSLIDSIISSFLVTHLISNRSNRIKMSDANVPSDAMLAALEEERK